MPDNPIKAAATARPRRQLVVPDKPEHRPARSQELSDSIQQSESRWRALLEKSGEFITIVAADGRILYDGPGDPGRLGYLPEEMVGKNVFELLPAEEHSRVLAEFQALLSRPGSSRRMELWARAHDGSLRALEVVGTNLLEDPAVGGVVLNSRDITDRKQAEEELFKTNQRLAALMEALPVGVSFSDDATCKRTTGNAALLAQYEAKPTDNLSASTADRGAHGRRIRYFRNGKPVRGTELPLQRAVAENRIIPPMELEIQLPGGRRWFAEASGAPVRDRQGNVIGGIAVAVDVTERKRTEAALRQVRDGLELRVQERTAELRNSNAALRRANRALQAISECDEALLRTANESDLVDQVCRIIVASGGRRMAWVGLAESDQHKTVRPVARAGVDRGYLETADVTWADTVRGRGPTGTAIRIGKACLCRDTETDPRFSPWRQAALKSGYRSVFAVPLIAADECLGALTIYAAEPDAFDAEERQLLAHLASDVGYGIAALRGRAEREGLQRELLRVSERERQRIAQELHDGLCQELIGIGLLLRGLHHLLAGQQLPEAKTTGEVADLLSAAIEDARNLAHGLHPVLPGPGGLIDALGQLAGNVSRQSHIRCLLHCPEPVLIQDNDAATHLFRIAQEAVSNAVKHGQPKLISISLVRDRQGITLQVRDDGRGLPKTPKKTGGLGLWTMDFRARLIGASVQVQRAGRRGTAVICRLPTPAAVRTKGARA